MLNTLKHKKQIVDEDVYINDIKNIIRRDFFGHEMENTPLLSLNQYLSKFTTQDNDSFKQLCVKELKLFAKTNRFDFDEETQQLITPNQLFFPMTSTKKSTIQNEENVIQKVGYRNTALLIDNLKREETERELDLNKKRLVIEVKEEKKPKKNQIKKTSFL